MALNEWKCTDCEQKFKTPNWACPNGGNHKVEAKTYFMDDAPTVADASGRVDKHSSTQILNIPPERRIMGPDGSERVVPGGSVWFIRGRYVTTDPEQQHWLDKKGGWCNEERWNQVYLNDQEKLHMERMKLAADRQRLEAERNELLASVQRKGA